jgi:hypothetical protein
VISRVLEQTKFPRGYYYKIDYYPSNTFETGDYVYALLQRPAEKAIVRKIGFYNVPEAFRDSDAIVRVNVDTLEYTFLYETEKGDRIVGFMNDYVYVFMDMRSGTGKKVVKYTLEAEEVAIIARDLPKNESFEFSVGEDGLSITDEKGATEVYAM